MEKKKFLLATMGTGGDLNPVIGIALELIQRGHDVTIASNGSHREKIERLGLDYFRLRPSLNQNQLQTWMRTAIQSAIRGNRYILRDLVLPHVEWNYHQLEKVVPEYDMLLCHTLAFSVPLVAKKLGKPWVSFTISPLVYRVEFERRRIIGRGSSRDFLWRMPFPSFLLNRVCKNSQCHLRLGRLSFRCLNDLSKIVSDPRISVPMSRGSLKVFEIPPDKCLV